MSVFQARGMDRSEKQWDRSDDPLTSLGTNTHIVYAHRDTHMHISKINKSWGGNIESS